MTHTHIHVSVDTHETVLMWKSDNHFAKLSWFFPSFVVSGNQLMLSVSCSWAISPAHIAIIHNLNSHIYNPYKTLSSQALNLFKFNNINIPWFAF